MAHMKNLIGNLPTYVLNKIEYYRFNYTNTDDYRRRAETRTRMASYVLGLRDAGLITEFERRELFVYMTVPAKEVEREG